VPHLQEFARSNIRRMNEVLQSGEITPGRGDKQSTRKNIKQGLLNSLATAAVLRAVVDGSIRHVGICEKLCTAVTGPRPGAIPDTVLADAPATMAARTSCHDTNPTEKGYRERSRAFANIRRFKEL
jgi:hypothetical protein